MHILTNYTMQWS